MWAELAAELQIQPWPPVPGVVFWSALMLVIGGALGELVFRLLALPRIVGYGAVGTLIVLAGHGLDSGRLTGTLRLVVDLGLGLLLFELGARVNLRWLRANPALLVTGLAESGLSFAAVALVLQAMGQDTAVALSCAALGVAASAATVGRVATELRSAGQVTERMIVLTALNTLLAVLLHKLVNSWLHLGHFRASLLPWDPGWVQSWTQGLVQPLYTLLGSLLLAAALARLLAWGVRRLDLRNENAVLLLLGLIVLALHGAQLLNLSTLLVPLIAGLLLRNAGPRPWVWPRHFGTAGGVLVLMLFIVVGSAWSLQALAAGGVLALALLACRGLAKAVAVVGLARWSGITWRQGGALSLALTPMSATTLVLLTDLHASHPLLAPRVAPIALSAIAIMSVLGPVAVQLALRLADECAAAPAPSPREG